MPFTRAMLSSALALAAVAAAAPAGATEMFGGVMAHDAHVGIALCCYERGTDFELGARSAPVASLVGGEIRAQAFGSVNSLGGVDFAAVGAVARWPLSARIYVQPGLGAAIHDGPGRKFQASPDRLYLGSRILFEPELSLGFRLSPAFSFEASLVHLSHARLGGRQNPGMDDVGVRAAYRFGG